MARHAARVTIDFLRILIAEAPFYIPIPLHRCPRKVFCDTAYCQASSRRIAFAVSARPIGVLSFCGGQPEVRRFMVKQTRLYGLYSIVVLALLCVFAVGALAADGTFAGKWKGESKPAAPP